MPIVGSTLVPSETDCLSDGLAAAARGDMDAWDLLVRGAALYGECLAIVDSVDESAKSPAKVASAAAGQLLIEVGGHMKTYSQLYDNATAIAGFLHRSGVRRGDMVAVMLRNCSQVCDWQYTLLIKGTS